jgi:hypothetical protein
MQLTLLKDPPQTATLNTRPMKEQEDGIGGDRQRLRWRPLASLSPGYWSVSGRSTTTRF